MWEIDISMNIHTLKIIFGMSVAYIYSFKTGKDQNVEKDCYVENMAVFSCTMFLFVVFM